MKTIGIKDINGQWHIVSLNMESNKHETNIPLNLNQWFPSNYFVFRGFSRNGRMLYREVVRHNI